LSVWAVLAAGGSGERLGLDRPKAFAPLRGRPLLAEPLERLDASDWIDGIVVAVPSGWEEPAILLSEEVGAGKVLACVEGGGTRAESVRAAVSEIPPDAHVILVHDVARPLVEDAVLKRVLGPLGEGWQGSVPALRVADTVKRVRGDEVLETVDRSDLVTVQTPQAFLADILRTALGGDVAEATDCASLVEAAGGRVRIVDGDPHLLKVTTPADLELVERLLSSRELDERAATRSP
jgi:2-C-methyl-D-erythritol 4-phosphate cytidylyltransferase